MSKREYSAAHGRATMKYRKENIERITLDVKKGTKDVLKSYAEKAELSLTEFMLRSAEEKAERDKL